MATEEFDLEAALRNVQSVGQKPTVERAHVFLPENMRAERKPKKPDWSILDTKNEKRANVEVVPLPHEIEKICKIYDEYGLSRAMEYGRKHHFHGYQVKEIIREHIGAEPGKPSINQEVAELPKNKVPWFTPTPVWDNLGRKDVQTSAQTERRDFTAEQVQAILDRWKHAHRAPHRIHDIAKEFGTSVEVIQRIIYEATKPLPSPAARRVFGCSVCGSKTVMCKDDGSPYEHKCGHHVWCKTKRGHPECPDCERELVRRMELAKLRQSKVQRQFAENVKQAEKNAPKVGWDIVEVSRPVKCPICQEFLQGKRAVRVWTMKDGAWVINNVQCLHHKPRPGVPLMEIDRTPETSEEGA